MLQDLHGPHSRSTHALLACLSHFLLCDLGALCGESLFSANSCRLQLFRSMARTATAIIDLPHRHLQGWRHCLRRIVCLVFSRDHCFKKVTVTVRLVNSYSWRSTKEGVGDGTEVPEPIAIGRGFRFLVGCGDPTLRVGTASLVLNSMEQVILTDAVHPARCRVRRILRWLMEPNPLKQIWDVFWIRSNRVVRVRFRMSDYRVLINYKSARHWQGPRIVTIVIF